MIYIQSLYVIICSLNFVFRNNDWLYKDVSYLFMFRYKMSNRKKIQFERTTIDWNVEFFFSDYNYNNFKKTFFDVNFYIQRAKKVKINDN